MRAMSVAHGQGSNLVKLAVDYFRRLRRGSGSAGRIKILPCFSTPRPAGHDPVQLCWTPLFKT